MNNVNLPTEIEIAIPSELGYEKVAMASVATAAEKAGFPPEKIEDIKTALAEACTNAIEHGNLMNTDAQVWIVLVVDQHSLQLMVIDEGHQMIPDEIPDRELRQDFRGMGLFLINNLMDKVEIQSEPGRNEIRMVSYVPIAA